MLNDVSVIIVGIKSVPLHLKHFLRLYSNSVCIRILLNRCLKAFEQEARTNCCCLLRKSTISCCNSSGKEDSIGIKKRREIFPQPLHGLATPVDIAL